MTLSEPSQVQGELGRIKGLSDAQGRLLIEIVAKNRVRVVDGYPPAKKLAALGYAAWFFTRHGQYLMPTSAGRALLSSTRKDERA